MKAGKTSSRRDTRGMVLPLVISVAVVLAILGIGLIQLGYGSQLMAVLATSGITARAAADAGLTHALYEMNRHFVLGTGWDGVVPPDVVGQVLPNANASFSYHIEGPFNPGTPGEHFQIDSTGTSGRETRIVHAITRTLNLFDYGLIVTDSIVLKTDTYLDGYDSGPFGLDLYSKPGNSGLDLRIGTNSVLPPQGTGDEGIILNSGATVIGDVLVGAGANPEDVIVDHGATTGPRYAQRTPFVFEPIVPPNTGPSLGSINDPNVMIGTLGTVTYRTYDNITVPSGGILTLDGVVHLRVLGDIVLQNGAEIRVKGVFGNPATYSSAAIYLDGNLRAGNSNGINNMTYRPANFRLFGTGPPVQNWEIQNSGNFYGAYYAPNADIIIKAMGDIFGSVSGKSFDNRNSANLHYDVRLADVSAYDTGFGIDRWWEEMGP